MCWHRFEASRVSRRGMCAHASPTSLSFPRSEHGVSHARLPHALLGHPPEPGRGRRDADGHPARDATAQTQAVLLRTKPTKSSRRTQDDVKTPSERWHPAPGSASVSPPRVLGLHLHALPLHAPGLRWQPPACPWGRREDWIARGTPRLLRPWALANRGLLVTAAPAGPTTPDLRDTQRRSCLVGPLPTPEADSILSVLGLTPQVKIRPDGSQEWGQSGHASPPKGPPSPRSQVPSPRRITGLCTQGTPQEASGEQ